MRGCHFTIICNHYLFIRTCHYSNEIGKRGNMETVADAFKGLAATVNSRKPQVTVKQFSDACSLFSGLFGILDTSFKFAKMDYVGKVFLLFCGC